MPRKPRIHYPGAVYHVILRGNAGQPVFFTDHDRYRLYLILQCVTEKFDCRIHGFCLMTNHVHLVVQTGGVPLSRIMQNLSLRYTKWINFTQSRTGHVFQGRYKALLLDADRYLLELVRYIHLNPVRAGMTATPDEYPWSSHRVYNGSETILWLTTDWVLSVLSKDVRIARKEYAKFATDGMGETRRAEFHSGTHEGRVLGDDLFVDTALTKANQRWDHSYRLEDIVGAVCRHYGITIEQVKAPGKTRPFSEARAAASLLVQELPGPSLTALGRLLNRDIAPLGRAGRRFSDEAEKSDDLKKRINVLRQELQKIAESLT